MKQRLFLGLLSLVFGPLAASAAPDCGAVDAALTAFAAEADKADSDNGRLGALVDRYLAAAGKCLRDDRTVTEAEIATAMAALEDPKFYVRRADLKVEEMRNRSGATVYSVEADVPGIGDDVLIATFSIPWALIDDDFPEMRYPKDPNPSLNIKPKTHQTADGRAAKVYIVEDGKVVSSTSASLTALHDEVLATYGAKLKSTRGDLAKDNLGHFAKEYRELHCVKGMSEKAAALLAIQSISFGQRRRQHPFCYRQFAVDIRSSKTEQITLKDGTIKACEVPTKVQVAASDRRAPCK